MQVGVGALGDGSMVSRSARRCVCRSLPALMRVVLAGLGAGPVPGSSQPTANAATARAVPSIRQRKKPHRVMDMPCNENWL